MASLTNRAALLLLLVSGRVAALHTLGSNLQLDVESQHLPSPAASFCAGPKHFRLNTSEIGAALLVVEEPLRHFCSPVSETEAAEIQGKTVLVQKAWGGCSLEQSYLQLVEAGARAIVLYTAGSGEQNTPGLLFRSRGEITHCLAAAVEDVPVLEVGADGERTLKLLVASTTGDVHLLLEPDSNKWSALYDSFPWVLVMRWVVPLLFAVVAATALYVASAGFTWGSWQLGCACAL
jgi:hypothetical protein